jgi:hypothetical protein
MQTPVFTGAQTSQERKWYWTRTALAGLLLVALAVLYFVLVLPVANAEIPPSNYRWLFQFITLIYAVDIGVLSIEFFYRLYNPAKPAPMRESAIGRWDVLGMALRFAFMLVLGGQYLTGAMISTPTIFQPVLSLFPQTLVGTSVPIFASLLHSWFAFLIILVGLAIFVLEVVKVGLHKQTLRDWLIKARYPQIKALYWLITLVVITQGILGLFLLGTISPIGPFDLVGLNSYGFETLIRHIHGPLGAVVFALFTNHIYYRLRPEYRIR